MKASVRKRHVCFSLRRLGAQARPPHIAAGGACLAGKEKPACLAGGTASAAVPLVLRKGF